MNNKDYMNNIDKYVKNIHDGLVKMALQKARNLQSLVLPYLSQSTASRIDWRGMTYPSVELRSVAGTELQADIVFKLPLVDGGSRYGVLEHKSGRDSGTYVQLYGYVDAIERKYHARGKVIAIVFYHGDRAWLKGSATDMPEAMGFQPIVIYVGDEVLDRADLTVEVRALVAVLRAGRRVGQAAVVAELAEQHLKPLCAEDTELFEEMVRYILSMAERARGLTSDEVLRIIEEHTGKEAREMGKSFIEVAWAEGRTEGMTEGRTVGLSEGKAEGRTEGKAEVVRRMLRERVDEGFIERVTGLSGSEIDTMRHSLNGS